MDINPITETKKIITFLRTVAKQQHIDHFVLGLSGGIDSATSAYLAVKAFGPKKVILVHMPYFAVDTDVNSVVTALGIPHENFHIVSIKEAVDTLSKTLGDLDTIRKGNLMARTRMILLFDCAKKYNALVIGTENKSEHLLSYFTRFGDEASDIEPIRSYYKTQVYQLANYLGVPQSIMQKAPLS